MDWCLNSAYLLRLNTQKVFLLRAFIHPVTHIHEVLLYVHKHHFL